jgi:hypothetical protein
VLTSSSFYDVAVMIRMTRVGVVVDLPDHGSKLASSLDASMTVHCWKCEASSVEKEWVVLPGVEVSSERTVACVSFDPISRWRGWWWKHVQDDNARLPSEVPGREVVQSSKELDLRS